MKNRLFAILFCLLPLCSFATQYTIVFNSGNADSTNPTSELTAIVSEATDNCVTSVLRANKIYRAKDGYGIKGGTGTAKGELSLGLDTVYHITQMTVYAATYPHAKDTANNRGMTAMGQTFQWEAGYRTVIRPYTLTLDMQTDSLWFSSTYTSNNRFYIQKIEFTAEDPLPGRARLTTPYVVDFGSEPIIDGEPAADVQNIEIQSRGVSAAGLALSLHRGTVFTLNQTSLPAEGGEVNVAYHADAAATLTDSLIITATGADGVTVRRCVPIKLYTFIYTPPTFDVDSSCMQISVAPHDYYLPIEGLQDSVLKSELGELIHCGVRYRYGAGSRKTWDGFYFTDRDTLTGEVLDMYSNNQRYFNSENPTASVTGFDIEHMLPKSWWGGEVNEAYCDLFHLVPGDYSANRSKSNHAPGIPSDTTFWNGSFATGSGSDYGLQKVFCPADEYKGDFARAYFYIATCYGDTLHWVESGEPAHCMTNQDWHEFRPWLYELLLGWHESDPVSEKEKQRAIEVNRIQGNRNPFIDYPELAGYIWGNQQGTAVRFDQLTCTYDNSQSETACETITAEPTAEKRFEDGQIVIIRSGIRYTVTGLRM